jgi:hypothetical protein
MRRSAIGKRRLPRIVDIVPEPQLQWIGPNQARDAKAAMDGCFPERTQEPIGALFMGPGYKIATR